MNKGGETPGWYAATPWCVWEHSAHTTAPCTYLYPYHLFFIGPVLGLCTVGQHFPKAVKASAKESIPLVIIILHHT